MLTNNDTLVAWLIFTSIIEMGFGGYTVNTSDADLKFLDSNSYGGLAVAIAVITLVTVTPM